MQVLTLISQVPIPMFEALAGIAATAYLGAIGWLFASLSDTSSRVAALEQRDEDLKEFINQRFDSLEQRLSRIEQRIDVRVHGLH